MVWKITDETFDTLGEEVRLTINGISIKAPQGQSLNEAARRAGISDDAPPSPRLLTRAIVRSSRLPIAGMR